MRNIQLQFTLGGILILTAIARAESPGLFHRGLDEARNGNCQAAEADFKNAIPAGPEEVEALTAIGVCESSAGRPELATGSFEAVTRLQPRAWQAWNNLGANYLALNRFDSAAQAFRKAIVINPNAVSAWFNLGLSLSGSGKKLEAFSALDHAQRIDPKDAQITQAWVSLADAIATEAGNAIDGHQYAAAFKMLSAVSRPLAKSASWNNLIGYAAFKLKKPAEAKRYLEAALQMDPDNEDYLLDAGEFLASYRDYGEAVRFFEIGAKRMPYSAPVRFGLAISYMLQDNTARAIVLLEQLHAEYPNWEPVDLALGECYESGMHWTAMIQLGAFLQSHEAKNALGWYLEGAGEERLAFQDGTQLSPAIHALQQAVALDPSSGHYYFALGRALEENKEFPGAIRELKAAIRLEPGRTDAHYALARVYKQMGNKMLANEQFQILSRMKETNLHDAYLAMLSETQRSRSGAGAPSPK